MVLRDTLLRAAELDLYQLLWSAEILEEARRNLVKNLAMTEAQAAHLIEAMTDAFPEARVEGYEPLIDAMPNQEKDRHVAAAAVQGGAQLIVTSNLKDFRTLPPGLIAQSPDDFLCDLFDLAPQEMIEALKAQCAALKKGDIDMDRMLELLAEQAPNFVAEAKKHI